jgi:hypothetical protein
VSALLHQDLLLQLCFRLHPRAWDLPLYSSSRLMLACMLVPVQVHPHQVPRSSAHARHNRGHADHFQGRWLGLSKGGQQSSSTPDLAEACGQAEQLYSSMQEQQQEHTQGCLPQHSCLSAVHGNFQPAAMSSSSTVGHLCVCLTDRTLFV